MQFAVYHTNSVCSLSTEYGGVYLDTDHLVLRPLDDLLNNSAVIGTETKGSQCGNGFLLAEPGAKFLQLWLSNYTDFRDSQWAEHSTFRPYRLSLDYPHLVRVVDSFFRPNYNEIPAFFDRKKVPRYDWAKHYGVHLYTRIVRNLLYGGTRIDRQDNVIGDMVRHILFGHQHACQPAKPAK